MPKDKGKPIMDYTEDVKLPVFDFDIEFEGEKREAGTLSYKSWRKAVFTRDGYICQECHNEFPAEELEAHHIKPFSIAPELQFAIDNGLTLCHECHVKTDSYGQGAKSLKRKRDRENVD